MTHYDIEMELSMTLFNMVRTLPYKQFSDKDVYADWLANYFERMIYIHPFREGMGVPLKNILQSSWNTTTISYNFQMSNYVGIGWMRMFFLILLIK